ncbi:hypothetical protein FisN_32Hu042 [Fistulifera solaris]|uniref:ferroxidase n=1 Tax=Fistulifera solaris TaxID=1519565 RepID=A0A1Z5K338_FISSO|nr:hypothetical protein FisN_32Hu042 [Fistulifera solaris]|eukprot:GAX20657.1 hypothetical protein FisN_32Hu042 [Fistulifera solaris]
MQHNQIRLFETEAEFHNVADEALETIQDTVDEMLEPKNIDYEINLASGVLTLKMRPHGTWVLNKQTPNRQIWWSSPLSGPKRFEFDPKDKLWFSTKDGLNLGRTLMQEIHHVYPEVTKRDLEL